MPPLIAASHITDQNGKLAVCRSETVQAARCLIERGNSRAYKGAPSVALFSDDCDSASSIHLGQGKDRS